MKILFSWIGRTDLDCTGGGKRSNIGPIATALTYEEYDVAYLFNNYISEDLSSFKVWIESFSKAQINYELATLSSPTNHKEIYEFVRNFTKDVSLKFSEAIFTFHTSPGTPAMAITWMLLAPVYGARLIETSKEAGLKTITLPFEISAYFVPDRELAKLSEGKVVAHPAFKDIIHTSSIMKETIAKAQLVAPKDITVLIEGESGTGKELFARAIHESSKRQGRPFIPVNCGAIPSNLIESVLFGHEKGAFTGADKKSDGHFHEAHTGTLFLDELGEISQEAQVALLRVIQENEVRRVGSSKVEKINVRIIAATNRNLMEEVAKGNFRADLFYRLAIACLYLPPLRERENDLSLLLDDAIANANKLLSFHGENEYKKFSDSAKKIMISHPWQGNVRELYNTVTRAILWNIGNIVGEESAKQALFQTSQTKDDLLEHPIGNGFSLRELLGDVAKSYIEKAEAKAHGNISKASKLLGFENYQTYTNWKKRYIITRD